MKFKFILFITLMVNMFSGCKSDFLDHFPETAISSDKYFNSPKDLELYTNTFYNFLYPLYEDGISDNASIFADAAEVLNLLRGNITLTTVGGWNNWGELRRINFLLENAHRVQGDQAEINHYVGIAKLMRAIWYYNMVKRYNDVPWYSTALKDSDEDLLYKGKDSRVVVVDSIMADLEFATTHISRDMKNKTIINKWFAHAISARINLHEGTFRKYHEQLNLQQTANTYLNKAVIESKEVIDSDLFSIDKSGGVDRAYANLFTSYSLSSSPEIILFKDYDRDENVRHPASAQVFDFVSSLSSSLMENYDVLIGGSAVDFRSLPNYDKKSFLEVFADRDPRFRQTFMYPGYVKPGQANPYRPNLNVGGYPQIKFVPQSADQVSWNTSYTDLPLSRFAEILLIYAEAKAELGTLNQVDVDLSINEIRSRVGMPPIVLSNLSLSSWHNADFPNVTGSQRAIILMVRKERRVELACEGFRYDDLMRWKAGELLGKSQQGVYISNYGLHDLTGDGVADVGIFANEASNNVPQNERDRYTYYYVGDLNTVGNSIYLSEGNKGFIMSSGDKIGTREFISPKYYFFPIPQTQLLLNTNLSQTINW